MTPDPHYPVLASLLGGGFVAAFLHAVLPTHWLPFVLVSRAQGWGLRRTLMVTTLAACVHVVSTAVVGSLLVLAGLALNRVVVGLLPHLATMLLFVFGTFYLLRAIVRRPVLAGGPQIERVQAELPQTGLSDRAAIGGLFGLMALSPGEVLLPVYLSSAGTGVTGFALLTLAFALGTVLGMGLLTSLASLGASVFRLEKWARHESAILGLALIGLGFLLLFRPH